MAKFDRVEMDFFARAFIAIAQKLIDPDSVTCVNLAGDPYWQSRLDYAERIALEMTETFQLTRDMCETSDEIE